MTLEKASLKTRGPRWPWIAHLNFVEDHSQYIYIFFFWGGGGGGRWGGEGILKA